MQLLASRPQQLVRAHAAPRAVQPRPRPRCRQRASAAPPPSAAQQQQQTQQQAQQQQAQQQQAQQQPQRQPQQQPGGLPACQPLDVLRAQGADGAELYLEVLRVGEPGVLEVAHQGVVYALEPQQSQQQQQQSQQELRLHPQRWLLSPEHAAVRALPGWGAALQAQQPLPQQPLVLSALAGVATSASQLQAAVQANPSLWCDGTGPGDPPLTGLQHATLCAGEIEALLCGARGVAMVQLWVGWDASAPQPAANPLALPALQRALARRDVCVFMSRAPGGLGLTAILAAKAEPFRSWGAHLGGFGAQAALVADSPFYKLLVGRCLGYKEPHIRHHIQATCGRLQPSPEVVAAVDSELAKLSKAKPRLPWCGSGAAAQGSSSGSGGRRAPRPKQGGGGGGAPPQQLSRSARKKAR